MNSLLLSTFSCDMALARRALRPLSLVEGLLRLVVLERLWGVHVAERRVPRHQLARGIAVVVVTDVHRQLLHPLRHRARVAVYHRLLEEDRLEVRGRERRGIDR